MTGDCDLGDRLGLKIAVSDIAKDALEEVGRGLVKIAGEGNVLVVPTDVAKLDEVVRLRDKVYEVWGEVSASLGVLGATELADRRGLGQVAVLFNNASVGAKGKSWAGIESWKRVFDVNLFGCVVDHCCSQRGGGVGIGSSTEKHLSVRVGSSTFNKLLSL